MATQAQISANQRNAQKSTGPRSDKGKAKSRENALKHGQRAFTLMPTLPSEDPQRIDERIQEWMDNVQPRNARERELTAQGAWLTIDIERTQRLGTGHMARRVVIAARKREQESPKRLRKQIEELGRRLLYIAGPEDIKVDKQPPGDDCPGLLVAELEDTAEGCRWLLERWAEYRNLLDTPHRVGRADPDPVHPAPGQTARRGGLRPGAQLDLPGLGRDRAQLCQGGMGIVPRGEVDPRSGVTPTD